jgi:hypothetical protein
MDNSHIQHYISSLHGSLNAGEKAVLLDEKILLQDYLCSNGAMILHPALGLLSPWFSECRRRQCCCWMSLNAGEEAVLLDEEFLLQDYLCSNMTMIL